MLSKFDQAFVYLSGAIDFAPDGGTDWRREVTTRLVDIGFNENFILSPTKKPHNNLNLNLDNEGKILAKLRKANKWGKFCTMMGEIAHLDLRLVDKSDFVIAYFPSISDNNKVPTYGTMHEIVVAREQQKPVLVVWDGGKKSCSGWLMWLVGHYNVFSTFNDLFDRLDSVSKGKSRYGIKDWLFMDFHRTYKERSCNNATDSARIPAVK